MSKDLLMILYMSLFGMVFFAIGALLIGFGYWMGRNSAEKPLRSVNNPSTWKIQNVSPTPEPEGDLFNEAAFGSPNETTPGIPTMGGNR